MQSHSLPGSLRSVGDVPSPLPFLWRSLRLRLLPSPHFFPAPQLLSTLSDAGAVGPETARWRSVLGPGIAPQEVQHRNMARVFKVTNTWHKGPQRKARGHSPGFSFSCLCPEVGPSLLAVDIVLCKLAFSRVIFQGKTAIVTLGDCCKP